MSSLAKQIWAESKVVHDSNIAAFKAQVTEARILWRQGAKVFSFAPASFVPLRSELIQASRSELTVKPGMGLGAVWGLTHVLYASGWKFERPRIL